MHNFKGCKKNRTASSDTICPQSVFNNNRLNASLIHTVVFDYWKYLICRSSVSDSVVDDSEVINSNVDGFDVNLLIYPEKITKRQLSGK